MLLSRLVVHLLWFISVISADNLPWVEIIPIEKFNFEGVRYFAWKNNIKMSCASVVSKCDGCDPGVQLYELQESKWSKLASEQNGKKIVHRINELYKSRSIKCCEEGIGTPENTRCTTIHIAPAPTLTVQTKNNATEMEPLQFSCWAPPHPNATLQLTKNSSTVEIGEKFNNASGHWLVFTSTVSKIQQDDYYCELNVNKTTMGAKLSFPLIKDEEKKQDNTKTLFIFITAGSVFVVALGIFLCRYRQQLFSKKKGKKSAKITLSGTSNYIHADQNDLTFIRNLGSGAFGQVSVCDWNIPVFGHRLVAHKRLFAGWEHGQCKKLREEQLIMKQIPFHNNVVAFLGAVPSGDGFTCLLTELCDISLKDHIMQLSIQMEDGQLEGEDLQNTLDDFVCYSMQIARGMSYIHKHFEGVHRDLACRNVLLTTSRIPRICDFGLSRFLADDGYYTIEPGANRVIPAYIYAPECLLDRKFSPRSDVWSFGVLLYELFTFGDEPKVAYKRHCTINSTADLYNFLTESRLGQPAHCSNEIYGIMNECWKWNSHERPTFDHLERRFKALLNYSPEKQENLEERLVESTNLQQEWKNIIDTIELNRINAAIQAQGWDTGENTVFLNNTGFQPIEHAEPEEAQSYESEL